MRIEFASFPAGGYFRAADCSSSGSYPKEGYPVFDFVDVLDSKPLRSGLVKIWVLLHVIGLLAATKAIFPTTPPSGFVLVTLISVTLAIVELEILSRAIKKPLGFIDPKGGNKLLFIGFGLAYALAIGLFVMDRNNRADEQRQQQQSEREVRERVELQRSLQGVDLSPRNKQQ
ncbi:MAG TPA: hypothetical protein VH370_00530 [Humisphaera sp.]|nr:hypothetical protein [Humisphaera sp.]